jgi:hypothetical protein
MPWAMHRALAVRKYSVVITMITVAISMGYLWLHCIALA